MWRSEISKPLPYPNFRAQEALGAVAAAIVPEATLGSAVTRARAVSPCRLLFLETHPGYVWAAAAWLCLTSECVMTSWRPLYNV